MYVILSQPRVALVTGDGVNSEAMGEVWHFFEQQIGYPINLIRYQDINRIKLADFDVVVMPDGRYTMISSDNLQNVGTRWRQANSYGERGSASWLTKKASR
jgi:hypothetical protein